MNVIYLETKQFNHCRNELLYILMEVENNKTLINSRDWVTIAF